MRSASAPIINQHKLARLTAWARLWLIWFAGAFAALWGRGEGAPARAFDHAARMVAQLVVIHAVQRLTPPRRGMHRHGRKKSANARILAGSALRRAMRGRDGAARLFAIFAVLREIDAHSARLARRLRAGLTRLRVLPPRADAPLFACAPAPMRVAFADTS